MLESTTFISVNEVKEILGVADTKAYQIIRDLNSELSEKGYMIVPGRISRQYFYERFYGLTNQGEGEQYGCL